MPTLDFDSAALMIALDATEESGVSPELVEQLRCLVRAREAWGENEDHPVRIGMPQDLRISQPLDPSDDLYYGARDPYRPRGVPPRHIVDAEWMNGDRLSGTMVQFTRSGESDRPPGEVIMEIGGKRLAFSVPGMRY